MDRNIEAIRRRMLLLFVEGNSTPASLLSHATPLAPCGWTVLDLVRFVVSTAKSPLSGKSRIDLGEASEYKLLDWQGVMIDESCLVVEIPKPGILVAIRGMTSVIEGALKVGVFGHALSCGRKSFVVDFLCSHDAQFEPMRQCNNDVYIRCSQTEREAGRHLQDILSHEALRTTFVASDNMASTTESNKSVKSLESTRAAVILVTKHSVQQPWVSQFAGAAWALNMPLIPVRIGQAQPPLPDFLSELQCREVNCESDWLAIAKEIRAMTKLYRPIKTKRDMLQ